ncbi:MAG TPA: glycosyltransferase family 39 protein [Solirubrobacteraceae bacterium]|jgi:4-amino-4-deoxy-L-arabinose transferase-like glycosyltransferase|nr:glycosyltransferase family 39 protein [Solirubrobacteraceae bacterium]
MTSAPQTSTIAATPTLDAGPAAIAAPGRRTRVLPQHIALAAVLALSAVLNVNHLSRNGYANTFYSAAVRSMLHSWHNFFFVSFDPGGMVTVDKPPLGLWVQGLSAALFGFHPLSLLLPEAIAGVLSVAALYWVVTPRFGPAAGVMSALALAVFPSFVAVSRDNNLDAVLILLMILACGVGLRAIGSGRLLTLLGCAALVGLAFNTKTLAAYLVVPGLALGYLVCAPGSLARRSAQLLAAGVVLLLVSASWSLVVELTPASQRPFVGGSVNNTERDLTFGYNGFGRVEGQVGGPGRIPVVFKHGSLAHIEKEALRVQATHGRAGGGSSAAAPTLVPTPTPGAGAGAHPAAPAPRAGHHAKKVVLSKYLPNGRLRYPVAFGGPTGPLRLFEAGLGGQAGWMLPFALVGLIALALWSIGVGPQSGDGGARSDDWRPETEVVQTQTPAGGLQRTGGRRDPRLAGLIVLGGWFLVEAAVLSMSKGIVHPYYLSALGPGTAAMVGAGAVAFVAPGARRRARLALIPIAVAGAVAAQLTLLGYDHYMHWFRPVLIVGCAVGVVAIVAVRRWTRPAMALTLGLLLLAPAAYAATTWQFAVEGTFPAAGPRAAGAVGSLGEGPTGLRVTKALLDYVDARHPGTRWNVLTEASITSAPMILLGHDAGAMGGYSGNDPAVNGPGLARLVGRGEARYVVLGGAYSERGGNAGSNAVIESCRVIPAAAWQPRPVNPNALLLYDCAGRERALRAH